LLETLHKYLVHINSLLIQEVQDFRRCIDYLETRADIDSEKIAYYGMSAGGWRGAIIAVVEDCV